MAGGPVLSSTSAPLSISSATVDATLAPSRRLLGMRAPARVRQARMKHAPQSPKKHLSKCTSNPSKSINHINPNVTVMA